MIAFHVRMIIRLTAVATPARMIAVDDVQAIKENPPTVAIAEVKHTEVAPFPIKIRRLTDILH